MSDQDNTQPKNNPVAILLVVLALVVVAGGAFFFTKEKKDDSALVAEGTEQSTEAPIDQPEGVPPVESATDAPATDEAPAEIVKLDVDEIMKPRVIGDANAPIKIVEYASLSCSHCAHFHNDILPALKSKYIDSGKVQLEFREFPLNDPALKAAIVARCLPPERYESFIGLLFKTQEHWAGGLDYMAALKQNAKLAGLSDARFDACINEPQLKVKIAERMQEAQDKWKVSSTPSFVINDKELVSGAAKLEELERVFRKVSDNAVGEAPAVE